MKKELSLHVHVNYAFICVSTVKRHLNSSSLLHTFWLSFLLDTQKNLLMYMWAELNTDRNTLLAKHPLLFSKKA